MDLKPYFNKLHDRVEQSSISNLGKDENGFFLPTKNVLLRHIQTILDLHNKPLARDRVVDSWDYLVENLPPEWLILSKDEKTALKKVLGRS